MEARIGIVFGQGVKIWFIIVNLHGDNFSPPSSSFLVTHVLWQSVRWSEARINNFLTIVPNLVHNVLALPLFVHFFCGAF